MTQTKINKDAFKLDEQVDDTLSFNPDDEYCTNEKTSIVTEIVLNMTVLMVAAIVLIATIMIIMLGWSESLLAGEEFTKIMPYIMVSYIAMFGLTVAIFGWRLISKLIVQPLRVLLDATEKAGQGELEHRVPILENNEIGDLAISFNNMIESLSENRSTLEEHVSELEVLNQDLARTQRELLSSEKLASVGRLAAGVAHEIGNPLASISGYLGIVGKRDYLKDLDREMIERIQSEVGRINEIIMELLDYSRPHEKSEEMIDLNDSVESALTLLSAQKGFEKIDLKTEFSDLPSFMGSKSAIQQVIMNLVLNSAYAMPDGGTLIIKTAKKEINGTAGSVLFVKDTGTGISESELGSIFDPFFTTKDPGEGTGLGLSVCQRIIEDLNGKISVSSLEGEGTEFSVWIPDMDMENQ